MPLVDPRHRTLFLALFGVFTIFGMSMTIIGAALPKILTSFGWSYFVAGLVLAANAIAYFTFTFVGGFAIRHLGLHPKNFAPHRTPCIKHVANDVVKHGS